MNPQDAKLFAELSEANPFVLRAINRIPDHSLRFFSLVLLLEVKRLDPARFEELYAHLCARKNAKEKQG